MNDNLDDYTPELTPWEQHAGHWVKRDDLYCWAGVRGGKTRTCRALSNGATGGLVTAGARESPQINIVAHVAARLGLPCRAHCPEGRLGAELLAAQQLGAEIVQWPAGRCCVLRARARADAFLRGWREIPFGMECPEAVRQTARQVANIPQDVRRLVVPVGSGMSLAGILHGLSGAVKVLGVVVGADPTRRLARYAPWQWRWRCELRRAPWPYDKRIKARLGDLELDPIYEAKCLPFLEPADALWVVGIR